MPHVSLPSTPPPAEGRAQRRSRVWIVDDSPLQLEACRVVLASLFDVTAFSSGSAVLEKLSTDPAPDVLVLDWQMPDITGLDVCRFTREQFDRAHLPVLIVTATGSGDNLLAALAAGANDFVRIPISDLELRARVAGLASMAALRGELVETQQTLRVEAEFRERFMAMLAHDLRQPLGTMLLANQVLGSPESTRRGDAVGMQFRAGQRMKRMIDELLDFTRNRPETGIPVVREPTDLLQSVQLTVDEMQPAWPNQPIRVHGEQPCIGAWDPDRLAQLCSNLIGNALEHSSPTSAVDIWVVAADRHAELTVSNEGPAIPAEVLPTLFRAFQRGKGASRSRGVGLGLYIVDQIVRAHGGTISAESDASGTHFRVTLPYEPVQ